MTTQLVEKISDFDEELESEFENELMKGDEA